MSCHPSPGTRQHGGWPKTNHHGQKGEGPAVVQALRGNPKQNLRALGARRAERVLRGKRNGLRKRIFECPNVKISCKTRKFGGHKGLD